MLRAAAFACDARLRSRSQRLEADQKPDKRAKRSGMFDLKNKLLISWPSC
jgi:hypothetical protein